MTIKKMNTNKINKLTDGFREKFFQKLSSLKNFTKKYYSKELTYIIPFFLFSFYSAAGTNDFGWNPLKYPERYELIQQEMKTRQKVIDFLETTYNLSFYDGGLHKSFFYGSNDESQYVLDTLLSSDSNYNNNSSLLNSDLPHKHPKQTLEAWKRGWEKIGAYKKFQIKIAQQKSFISNALSGHKAVSYDVNSDDNADYIFGSGDVYIFNSENNSYLKKSISEVKASKQEELDSLEQKLVEFDSISFLVQDSLMDVRASLLKSEDSLINVIVDLDSIYEAQVIGLDSIYQSFEK